MLLLAGAFSSFIFLIALSDGSSDRDAIDDVAWICSLLFFSTGSIIDAVLILLKKRVGLYLQLLVTLMNFFFALMLICASFLCHSSEFALWLAVFTLITVFATTVLLYTLVAPKMHGLEVLKVDHPERYIKITNWSEVVLTLLWICILISDFIPYGRAIPYLCLTAFMLFGSIMVMTGSAKTGRIIYYIAAGLQGFLLILPELYYMLYR